MTFLTSPNTQILIFIARVFIHGQRVQIITRDKIMVWWYVSCVSAKKRSHAQVWCDPRSCDRSEVQERRWRFELQLQLWKLQFRKGWLLGYLWFSCGSNLQVLHVCGCCFAMLAGCKRDAQRHWVELWRGIWPDVAQWLWEGC